MFRPFLPGLLLPALLLPLGASAQGFTESAGVNATADEGFGARHTGMAASFAGFQRDANAVANAPAGMNDVDDVAFATAHAEKFGEAKYDDFAFLLPFEANSTLGLGLSRYGVSSIDLRPEGVTPTSSTPFGEFSTADYSLVAAFARRWGGFDLGGSLHMLYRQLDQDGFGMRADAMAQYTHQGRFRLGALLKGLLPSAARWESGYGEYEPTDLYLAAATILPAPYFYGTLEVAGQTEGLFQRRAKAQSKAVGSRFYQSPLDFLAASNLGAEFRFDFGLALRFGLNEIFLARDPASSTTFGLGYNWLRILGLDYSFSPHPDLDATHRLSLQFTPVFPRFNGRDFRNQGRPAAKGNYQDLRARPWKPAASKPEAATEKKEADPAPDLQKSAPETKPAEGQENGGEILEQEE